MFKRKRRGTCRIHGDYDGQVCGFCAMGMRLKDLDRNALVQRIEELEAENEEIRRQYANRCLQVDELQCKYDALDEAVNDILPVCERMGVDTDELRALLEEDDG